MSTNQISKPVDDSNTEGDKTKEFEDWIMYFVIEKGSDADVVWHFFICMLRYPINQRATTVSLHAISHLGCVSTEHDDFMQIKDCFTVIAMGYSKWHQYIYKLVDAFNYRKWRYTDAKVSHILKSTAVRGENEDDPGQVTISQT